MRPRDFFLLLMICVVWALNAILSKVVVSTWQVPPIFFAAARFGLLVLVTLPWLLPVPKDIRRVATIGLMMGAINFSLLFVALQTVTPSVSSIVIQAGVPFTTILSVFMLDERISWRRGGGIVLTLTGILLVVWKPGEFEFSWGVWLVLASCFGASLGSVMMKQVEDVGPMHFQAWVGMVSFFPLALGTAIFEQDQWRLAAAAGWPFVGVLVFAALIVSIFAHGNFYTLIRRYDANLIVPLTLMNPLFTVAFGIVLLNDHFDLQMAIGAALALAGVFFIAVRSKASKTALPLMIEREQG